MMKILILKTFPKEIKTAHLTYNVQEIGLAIALRKAGHKADVLCCSDDGKNRDSAVEQEGVRLTVYARRAYRVLKNGWLKRVENLLAGYDIIQTAEYNQIYSWHLAKKYPDKVVIYHGPYYSNFNINYNRMTKVFDALFLQRYKCLNTPFITKSRLSEQYLRNKGLKNVEAIGVGLNTIFFNTITAPESEAIQYITNYRGLKLLYVGTLEERRHPKFLIEVLAQVKHAHKNVKLVLVGKYTSINYKNEFQSIVESSGLTSNIIHIDSLEQNQLASIYKACDIFLFPTRYDIYGMVLLEAMYFGLPVISTINGGSDMMIRDGVNGYIIEKYDVNAWVNKILSIMQNIELYKRISNTAIDTIRNRYTWDVLAERFVEVYRKRQNNQLI